MELKKTRIRHRRYTASQWAERNLMCGEIGILLSEPDSNGKQDILQVRMGVKDDSTFGEGFLLGLSGTDVETTRQVPTYYDLPSIGNEQVCYIIKSNNSIWRWDDTDMRYYECSSSSGNSDWRDIQEVNGGSASNGYSL